MTPSASPEPVAAPDRGELAGWLRLILAPGLGASRQRQLLAAFGPPERIFTQNLAALAAVIGEDAAARLLAGHPAAEIDAHLAWAAQPGNRIVTLADAQYPRALLTIADPPVLLFARGRLELLQAPALAIIGARSATPQGQRNAEAFARALSAAGLVIVSGMALGVDAAAHRGALRETGGTIAVVGTGADRIYPARNATLAREIAELGLMLSEFPLGTPAQRQNFPRRNRLISGLASGVLVVEAGLASGSLITARLAGEQGREVFAIPGSIHSPLARGCHRLIRDGAKLVESAQDVLEELRLPVSACAAAGEPAGSPPAPEQRAVIAAMGHDPVDIDSLLQRSGLTSEALSAILLAMELDGIVARLPGGLFQRTP